MNNLIYVNIPAQSLSERIDFLIDNSLQPEVACQTVSLDQLDFQHLNDTARRLHHEGLKITLHAPFSGFAPGTSDQLLRNSSFQQASRSLKLAECLKAHKIIFHPSIPQNRENFNLQEWIENSLTFWPELILQAEQSGCVICLENIYEDSPDPLLYLFESFASEHFRHVFDLGHWNIYGQTSLEHWLDATRDYLSHIHLHNNFGNSDDHYALSAGTAPVEHFFQSLGTVRHRLTYTLENRTLPDILDSHKLTRQFLLDK